MASPMLGRLRPADPDTCRGPRLDTLRGVEDRGRTVVGVATHKGTERLYYDKESGRLVRQELRLTTDDKKLEVTVATFDYQDVGGVTVARKQVAKRDGKVVLEVEVVEVQAGRQTRPEVVREAVGGHGGNRSRPTDWNKTETPGPG